MAGLTWIFFGICVVTCSAQFGYNPRDNPFFSRQKSPDFQRRPDPLLQALQKSGENENKCYTLARRPFYMSRPMQYPCNRRMNGVPVAHSFMGKKLFKKLAKKFAKTLAKKRPFGPTCVSFFREPVHRYYRIEVCCPGFTADRNGKCIMPVGRNVPEQQPRPQQQQQQQQQQQKQQRNMLAMAAEMRNIMMLRAKASMARRQAMMGAMHRQMMMGNMRRRMHRQMMSPSSRGPCRMCRMGPMFARMMNRPVPPMFRRPRMPLPLPRPVQRPPINSRIIKIVRRPMILSTILRVPLVPSSTFSRSSRQPTRMVLSNQSPDTRISLQKLHPEEPQIPRPPEIPVPQDFPTQEDFVPGPDSPDGMFVSDGYSPDTEFQPQHLEAIPDLPDQPVEMPKLIVEQAPSADGTEVSCIMTLNTAVKSCLRQNNIDVPDVMSAFGPFNEEMSSALCHREEAIFTCISEALAECNSSEDAQMARDMLLETADTVRAMCVHREMVVGPVDGSQPLQTAQSNEATSARGADTMATVENVDAIPTDVKLGTEQITVIEDTAPPAAGADQAASIRQAVQHEVHVQEVDIREYYLPLLIGSGLGFVVLVLTVALLLCCCCRRRLHKKMRMAKEAEKPPLHDEIYTIGIAPPTYEVNGIPPMYYEEAKGEKITSRSPAVLQGTEEGEAPEGDLGEGTKM